MSTILLLLEVVCYVTSDKHCSYDFFSRCRINSLALCYEHQSLTPPALQGLYKNVCHGIQHRQQLLSLEDILAKQLQMLVINIYIYFFLGGGEGVCACVCGLGVGLGVEAGHR